MKYFSILFIVFFSLHAYSQRLSINVKTAIFKGNQIDLKSNSVTPNPDFLALPKSSRLVAVNTANPYFQKTYMIDKEGRTISSGFMPSAYFKPNDNFIIINGRSRGNDSYNPYGAYNLSSMLLFGTINTFIPKFKIKLR